MENFCAKSTIDQGDQLVMDMIEDERFVVGWFAYPPRQQAEQRVGAIRGVEGFL